MIECHNMIYQCNIMPYNMLMRDLGPPRSARGHDVDVSRTLLRIGRAP